MKFIHMADLHFDTPLIALKNNRELIKKRRTEHRQVFRDVIQLAKKENIDFLFISGDMFEQKFVEKGTIEFIISSFQLIPDTKIFISPGNHDPLIKSSPYLTYDWPENVTIFNGEIGKYSYDNINIYGLGFTDYEFSSDEISKLELDEKEKLNILVIHGTLNGGSKKYLDLKTSDLNKFDYVALGHIHEKKVDGSKIIYPGSLMSIGFDELGEHGIVIGELEKNNIRYEFKNMEYKHFEIMNIDITNFKSSEEILNYLDLQDNIYRIELTGERNVDVSKIKEIIKEQDKSICEIKDTTHISYDLKSIASQKTLKGFFTKKMLEEIAEHPERREEIISAVEMTFNIL